MTENFMRRAEGAGLAVMVFSFALLCFSESEADLKKRILSNADLAGESAESLMAGDDEDGAEDAPSAGSGEKRLPSAFERDVTYTDPMREFIEAYCNHKILSDADLERYYDAAVRDAELSSDEYSRLVRLARAEYYYGLALIETFDLTALEDMDLSDTSSGESVNERAGQVFDRAVALSESALALRKGSDAYTVLSQSVSENCMAKNVSYVLANGLKVRAFAKKAVKADYSNGTAHFLVIAQDIFAPWPFSKLRSGRKKLLAVLDDKYIRIEKSDRLSLCSAMGYSYFKQKKWSKAEEWYHRALELYPDNYSVRQMLGKIEERKRR